MDESAPGSLPPEVNPLSTAANVALRLLSGVVSKTTYENAQAAIRGHSGAEADSAMIDAVLAEHVDRDRLLRLGVRAERDWLLRGGPPSAKTPRIVTMKRGVMRMLVMQLVVFFVYSALLVLLLLALRVRSADWDVYRLLDWAKATFPTYLPPIPGR